MEMLSSTSPPERTRYSPIPPSHHQLTLPDPSHHGLHSNPDSPAKPEKNGHAKIVNPRIAKFFEIQTMPNGKTRTSLKTMSRRKLSQQKEKKATQMLAIVLGESTLADSHSPGWGMRASLQVPDSALLTLAQGSWAGYFLSSRPHSLHTVSIQLNPPLCLLYRRANQGSYMT